MIQALQDTFAIRRDERWLVLTAMLALGFFQYLTIVKFAPLFADYSEAQWTVFMRNYHMSGFDPISYAVITDWHQGFDILRHPLLAYLLYPLYLANRLLWGTTGMNCVQWVYGSVLYGCAIYAMLFLHRILREVVGISRRQATLLTACCFGFAYILLSTFVADHFGLSLFLLLLTLYRGGIKLVRGQHFSPLESIALFTLTAGVTLSNGVSVFIIVAAVNGRCLWHIRPLVLCFALPSLLLLGSAQAYKWSQGISETPIESQLKDTYRGLNRADILVENLFGESIQLHRRHILGDALVRRPVVVRYSWTAQYVAEAVYMALFTAGVWMGRRSRFLWGCMGILGFTLLFHVGLGFGLNEVYIMAAHWAFVVVIAMAYLFRSNSPTIKIPAALLLLAITLYLWAYHGVLLYRYLTWPLSNS